MRVNNKDLCIKIPNIRYTWLLNDLYELPHNPFSLMETGENGIPALPGGILYLDPRQILISSTNALYNHLSTFLPEPPLNIWLKENLTFKSSVLLSREPSHLFPSLSQGYMATRLTLATAAIYHQSGTCLRKWKCSALVSLWDLLDRT